MIKYLAAFFAALGLLAATMTGVSADGEKDHQDSGKITICHHTGSASNPFVEITIDKNGLKGHDGHDGDIIPAPASGCPTATATTSTESHVKIHVNDIDQDVDHVKVEDQDVDHVKVELKGEEQEQSELDTTANTVATALVIPSAITLTPFAFTMTPDFLTNLTNSMQDFEMAMQPSGVETKTEALVNPATQSSNLVSPLTGPSTTEQALGPSAPNTGNAGLLSDHTADLGLVALLLSGIAAPAARGMVRNKR